MVVIERLIGLLTSTRKARNPVSLEGGVKKLTFTDDQSFPIHLDTNLFENTSTIKQFCHTVSKLVGTDTILK